MSKHVCGWDDSARTTPRSNLAPNDASYCLEHERLHTSRSGQESANFSPQG
ncbi:Uncharacterised protein [Mycobacteroides abscessus subsp. bolletii]|nr:Uncharacterised protein [Mycobacteroides abscessus subsp. abscessus]SKU94614.1 Uncharacterised protein [Mycobacteroides abscessus subsp. bolletii]SLC71855.1 Uncharacterised protein [Mycobacteroides abscessus subsp. massiliense]SLJ49518.1 Uncharacterised protein [Mycobacteroides abscessus subsp. abscessus]